MDYQLRKREERLLEVDLQALKQNLKARDMEIAIEKDQKSEMVKEEGADQGKIGAKSHQGRLKILEKIKSIGGDMIAVVAPAAAQDRPLQIDFGIKLFLINTIFKHNNILNI